MTRSRKTTVRLVAGSLAIICGVMMSGCANGGTTGGKEKSAETVTIATIPGWNDYTGAAYILQNVLTSEGYKAEVKKFSDIGIVYLAASKGDIDFFSGSPENLQTDYWKKYKNDLEDLARWYDDAAIFLAVPDYVHDVNSLQDLKAHADEFGRTIYGIEPGTGYMKDIRDALIPQYGLSGVMNLATSSSVGMLTTLKAAVAKHQPVVVSSWSPYWANSTFHLKALKDPKNTLGKPEREHILARKGFAADDPKVAAMISKLKLTDAQVNQLDYLLGNKFKPGEEKKAAAAWLKEYPAVEKKLRDALRG